MKKIGLILVVLISFAAYANSQHITNETKTYYDEEQTKLKEVFSFKEGYTISKTGDHSIVDTKMTKHGPYFYYYESGKLKISGWYNSGKKDKTWKYFDENGTVLKTEEYKNGELISSK